MRTRSRTLAALVDNKIRCVHQRAPTLKKDGKKYFGEKKDNRQIPGALKLLITGLGPGTLAAPFGATVSGKNSD